MELLLLVYRGEISLETAPVILFHYSLLFSETNLLGASLLKLREPLPQEFRHNNLDFNIGVLFPEKLEKQVKKLTEGYYVNIFLSYTKAWKVELLNYATSPWLKVARYYDNDPQRGQIFGTEVWRNATFPNNSSGNQRT